MHTAFRVGHDMDGGNRYAMVTSANVSGMEASNAMTEEESLSLWSFSLLLDHAVMPCDNSACVNKPTVAAFEH